MLLHLFINLYHNTTACEHSIITMHQAHCGIEAEPTVFSRHGFTSKEKGAGKYHVCDQDFPNSPVCSGIIQHSHNEFCTILVALNSLHMVCRVDLCREHNWGFHMSGNPSCSSKLAHWHSGACIIFLNPSDVGRKRKYGPINSYLEYSGREGYSSVTAAESYSYSPTMWRLWWCILVSPITPGLYPFLHLNPTFSLLFPLALGQQWAFFATFV